MDDEAILLWWTIVATLKQNDLWADRAQPDKMVVPEADALVLPDRIVFILDPERPGGIQRSEWLDAGTRARLEEALGGRRVVISEADRLAVSVARTMDQNPEPTRPAQ